MHFDSLSHTHGGFSLPWSRLFERVVWSRSFNYELTILPCHVRTAGRYLIWNRAGYLLHSLLQAPALYLLSQNTFITETTDAPVSHPLHCQIISPPRLVHGGNPLTQLIFQNPSLSRILDLASLSNPPNLLSPPWSHISSHSTTCTDLGFQIHLLFVRSSNPSLSKPWLPPCPRKSPHLESPYATHPGIFDPKGTRTSSKTPQIPSISRLYELLWTRYKIPRKSTIRILSSGLKAVASPDSSRRRELKLWIMGLRKRFERILIRSRILRRARRRRGAFRELLIMGARPPVLQLGLLSTGEGEEVAFLEFPEVSRFRRRCIGHLLWFRISSWWRILLFGWTTMFRLVFAINGSCYNCTAYDLNFSAFLRRTAFSELRFYPIQGLWKKSDVVEVMKISKWMKELVICCDCDFLSLFLSCSFHLLLAYLSSCKTRMIWGWTLWLSRFWYGFDPLVVQRGLCKDMVDAWGRRVHKL